MVTIKQKLFVKRYVENKGNGTQAALDVYDVKNSNTAHAIASENLRKPTIQQAIHQALEAKGLDPLSIGGYLKEAIVSGLGVKATNADSLRGIDLFAKLTGAYQNPIIRESYEVRVQKMSKKEVMAELARLRKSTAQLLKDTNS